MSLYHIYVDITQVLYIIYRHKWIYVIIIFIMKLEITKWNTSNKIGVYIDFTLTTEELNIDADAMYILSKNITQRYLNKSLLSFVLFYH